MFLRMGPDRQRLRVAALIPNLLTTAALCCGLASLHFAMKPDWDKAMAALVLAAVFDLLDGRAARMLHVTSPFGAVLDSLSDFLSFGVAPALLLHQWQLGKAGGIGLAAVMTYALCAGLRLARFTAAATPKEPKDKSASAGLYFVGMPTPAAAGAALLFPMLERSETLAYRAEPWMVIAFIFIIAMLMISRVPMFSLKRLRISRRYVAPILVTVGLLVVGLSRDPWLTIASVSAVYVVTIPVAMLVARRPGASPADAPPTPDEGH